MGDDNAGGVAVAVGLWICSESYLMLL
jgi:hypothetical protein